MNIVVPTRQTASSPVCVFIHGGSWQRGDKMGPLNFGIEDVFARAGYIGVSINYRLSPKVMHPDHTRDVASALSWLQQNLPRFGGDPQQMILIGHSAGAHLMMTVLADPQFLDHVGISTAQTRAMVKGIVGISGVYNIVRVANAPWYGQLVVNPVFGSDVSAWRKASIVSILTREGEHSPLRSIPIQLLNAQEDFHLHEDSRELQMWLSATGAKKPEHIVVPSRNHFSIIGQIASDGVEDLAVHHILAFVDRCVTIRPST